MINSILNGFSKVGNFVSHGFSYLFDLLEKPLGYLLAFLEGIFYFFACLFKVVVLIVKIFTALFQFFWALSVSVLKTLGMWIGLVPSGSVHMYSEIKTGFDVVVDKLMPTGLMTIVPTVATAFLWLYFGFKVFSLYGGSMGFSFPERSRKE